MTTAAIKNSRRARPKSASRPAARTKGGTRAKRSAERHDAILSAALEEFSGRGFAATRLDDVARRAGVAKGTIYLYFADKETLFQELARSMLSPVVGHIEGFNAADLPFRVLAERLIEMFVRDIIGSRRKDIIRLIIAEGPRFPALAEFYYREVLSRVMAAIGALLQRAYDRGEIRHEALARYPQLFAAPALIAIIWSGLFERFSPLDARAMLRTHLDMILDERAVP